MIESRFSDTSSPSSARVREPDSISALSRSALLGMVPAS